MIRSIGQSWRVEHEASLAQDENADLGWIVHERLGLYTNHQLADEPRFLRPYGAAQT